MLLNTPMAMNYFEIFGIPASYNLDVSHLTEAYLQKQGRSHPDVGGGASDSEDSALLNVAYGTLLNPLKRAEYLLNLDGSDISATSSDDTAAKIFELREKWASLESRGERARFCGELRRRTSDLIDSLGKHEKNPEEFRKIFCELRYVDAFLEKVADGDDGGWY
ncbi:MAG: Fe-S protein assembly co-chaperone HscB [Holosporaceae bacterium]|jgi:molecular chaperone HscB|nr:Fe-S protein assembly co-chaperone HscB [Holosporaceae bacterium]